MTRSDAKDERYLLLLRHAKSSWKDPNLADFDRPLNKRGRRDAPRLGEVLRETQWVPEWIVTSAARRARETTRLLTESCQYDGPIEVDRCLYAAPAEAYMEAAWTVPAHVRRLMLVGHNPGISDCAARLADAPASLPTTGIAVIRLALDAWENWGTATRGTLVWLWYPKMDAL